jgi:predicted metal-binding membrane protein
MSPSAAGTGDPRAIVRRPAVTWPAFFAIVLAAWVGLFAIAKSHGEAPVGGFGWRAILDPEMLVALCLRPGAPESASLTLLMWCLMVLAMMSPVATPMLATVARLPALRTGIRPNLRWWAMAAGHATVWLGFATIAAVLQVSLHQVGLLTAHGASLSGGLSVLLLAGAGLYQFSAFKTACLSRCRSPMSFLIAHWREGASGAFRMGLGHGLDCVGCCWALMLLAFVGGSMDLAWMGLAMALMIAERLSCIGRRLSAPIGVLLLAGAIAVAWNTWIA